MTESSTFYDKLTGIQAKCKAVLEASSDPSTHPTALLMLSNVNSIVQTQQLVAMMNVVVQELQSAKTAVTQWRDARGIFFLCAIDGTTVRTYSPSGEVFIPVEPCSPADRVEAAPSMILKSYTPTPAIPSHVRIVGMERVEIPAGAIAIEINIKSGEVSSSGGVGTLIPGDKFKWEYQEGLTGIAFVGGTPDTEYSIAIVRPALAIAIDPPVEEPEIVSVAGYPPSSPLTAELIPAPAILFAQTPNGLPSATAIAPSLADLAAAIA
jgi:hypothetical protein